MIKLTEEMLMSIDCFALELFDVVRIGTPVADVLLAQSDILPALEARGKNLDIVKSERLGLEF